MAPAHGALITSATLRDGSGDDEADWTVAENRTGARHLDAAPVLSSLGIAVLITLATTLTSHLIGKGHAVLPALTDGFRLAYFIGAGLCAAAAVVTFTLVPGPAAAEQTAPATSIPAPP